MDSDKLHTEPRIDKDWQRLLCTQLMLLIVSHRDASTPLRSAQHDTEQQAPALVMLSAAKHLLSKKPVRNVSTDNFNLHSRSTKD